MRILSDAEVAAQKAAVRKRGGRRAKNKGANFERELAQQLSDWWGSEFRRTPMSGGSQLKAGWDLAGDVATPDATFRFHLEAKNRNVWPGLHTLNRPKSIVWKWWVQALRDCPDYRVPLLVFTRNQYPVYCMMTYWYYISLLEHDPHYAAVLKTGFQNLRIIVSDVMVMPFENLLAVPKGSHMLAMTQYFTQAAASSMQKCPKCGKILLHCTCSYNDIKK